MDASRRDPKARTRGADSVTMLLWLTIESVPGITRDGLVERVGPRVNEGHAKRRFLAKLQSDKARYRGGANGSAPPRFEELNLADARRYLIVNTLGNMRRNHTVECDDRGGYHALRRPKTETYTDDAMLDVNGDITRRHFQQMEARRILERADDRWGTGLARLTQREREALKVLLDSFNKE